MVETVHTIEVNVGSIVQQPSTVQKGKAAPVFIQRLGQQLILGAEVPIKHPCGEVEPENGQKKLILKAS